MISWVSQGRFGCYFTLVSEKLVMTSTSTHSSVAISDERDDGAFIPSFLDDFGLSPFEFRLYSHIARRAGGQGQCWEGIDKMAKVCRMERKTAYKAFQFLEDHRMIRVERKKGATSHVTLTNRSAWIPPDQEVVSDRPTRPPHPLKGTSKKKNSGCAENGIGVGCTLNGISPVPQTGYLPIPETGQPPIPNTVHKGTPYEGTPIEGSPNKEKERADDFFVNSSSPQNQENSFPAQTNPKIQETPIPPTPSSPSAPENIGKAIAISKQADAYRDFEAKFSSPAKVNKKAPLGLQEEGYGDWHLGVNRNNWKPILVKAAIIHLRDGCPTMTPSEENAIRYINNLCGKRDWPNFELLADKALKLEAAEAIATQYQQQVVEAPQQQPAPQIDPIARKRIIEEARRKVAQQAA